MKRFFRSCLLLSNITHNYKTKSGILDQGNFLKKKKRK